MYKKLPTSENLREKYAKTLKCHNIVLYNKETYFLLIAEAIPELQYPQGFGTRPVNAYK
jgi:hypothetical protein